MIDNEKKEREFSQLEKALKLLNFNNFKVVDKHNESPDFLLTINGVKTGIEITTIYPVLGNGNSAKTQSDLPKIVEDVIAIYNSKCGIPLNFGFGFNGDASAPNRNNVSEYIAEYLLKYTQKNFENGIEPIQEIDVSEIAANTNDLISHILVETSPSNTSTGFTTSMFTPAPVEDSVIENAICKKEKLRLSYLKRCKKIWLIITLPKMLLAKDYFFKKNKILTIKNKFDAIYVLDEYRNDIIEIKSC